MVKLRRIIQIFFIIFFIFLFLKARYPYSDSFSSDLFLRFSPLIPLYDFIENININWMYWPALTILLLTVFLGRFFCGWICPLGTSLDMADRLIRSPSNQISSKFNRWRYLKFAILSATLLSAFFSINLWSYFDPLALFNRTLAVVIYPLATLLTESTILKLSDMHFLEDTAYWFYDIFKALIMPEDQSFFQQVFWIGLLFTGILAAEKLSRRFWCRYLCPAGAWLGILSQFRFYERIVGESCPVCNKCQVECKMNAIPDRQIARTSKVECIECFNCGALCPPKTKAITYQWRWKPYHTPLDFSRRRFLSSTAAGLAAVGLFSIGIKDKNASAFLIRPPGSLPENDFLIRCIRCQECVRICSTNGRCLQPSGIYNNLTEWWTPVAVMRNGYCEYNCNLCGLVCPTEAILPLSADQKKKTPVGLANFNKNLCIPFVQNKDCIVCEEHCPTPDKAIKFEIKKVNTTAGSQKTIKYPYVVRSLCIGCGICEEKCPLPGEPGIYVTTENQMRLTNTGIL